MVDDAEMIHAKLLDEHTRLNAQLQDVKQVSAGLLREAIEEIHALRRHVGELEQYRRHTERMLALFEGVPGREFPGEGEVTEDVTWRLARRAEEYAPRPKGGGSG